MYVEDADQVISDGDMIIAMLCMQTSTWTISCGRIKLLPSGVRIRDSFELCDGGFSVAYKPTDSQQLEL